MKRFKLFRNRKVEETVKFVLTAIVVAVLLITFSQGVVLIKKIWSYMTEIDLGYMWVVNLFLGWGVATAVFFPKSRKDKLGVLENIAKFIVFLAATLISEIVLWHRQDLGGIIRENITWGRIVLAGVGILSATIAFVIHLKGIVYPEEEFPE